MLNKLTKKSLNNLTQMNEYRLSVKSTNNILDNNHNLPSFVKQTNTPFKLLIKNKLTNKKENHFTVKLTNKKLFKQYNKKGESNISC